MREKEVPASQSTNQTMSDLHQAIRREFPRADADANGRRRIFFENAAGSLVLQRAVEAEAKARLDYSANVDGPFWESKMNEEVILGGRKAVRDFLNAPSEDCIISGESATSILFSLSYALSKEISGNENIVLTEYEHYANASPWLELEQRGVVKEVRFVRFNRDDGQLDISHLESLLDKNTRVVSVAGVSNVLGSKTPAAQVFKLAKEVGAYAVLDGVHTVPHIPVDVVKLGCDFAVFSAYKLFSRRGSFAYGRRELLENLKPYKVKPAPDKPPEKWEMGTRDQALFASITAVIDYLNWLGSQVESEVRDKIADYAGRKRTLKAALSWIEKYEQTLSNAMLGGTNGAQGMQAMKGLEVYGVKDPSKTHLRVPTFTFNIEGADPFQVAQYLWGKHSIAVLAEDGGGFYSRTLKTYGKSIGVRASLVHFNIVQEVETFLRALADTMKHFIAA
ncbi:MAG: aminotransferase class V-fold PLP-dependent enzyme [Candidatus Bathyarchaeia archaeon]|jgi:selenocysteine lyase/cysteine desulfurase